MKKSQLDEVIKKMVKKQLKEDGINTYRDQAKDSKYEIKIIENGKVIDHSSINYEGALLVQDFITKLNKTGKYKYLGK